MKKRIKKVILLLVSVLIVSSGLAFTTNASGSTISLSKSNLTVGDTLTVTVTISADEAIYAAEFSLSYNSDVLKFVSGDSANGAGAGHVKFASGANGEKKKSYSSTFTVIASGSSSISVSDAMYAADSEVSVSGSSVTVNAVDPVASDNADLSSLKLSSGTLSPKFSKNTTSYKTSVDFSVTQCKIYATAADQNCKVEVSGTANLDVGDTTRVVTVTAPSGKQKSYTILITRKAEDTTSSNVSSDTNNENTSDNPYSAIVNGEEYVIQNDLNGITIPKSFTQSTATVNDVEIPVIKDEKGNYEIFYLKANDNETPQLFTYDKVNKTFEPLKYTYFGETLCIFAEPEFDSLAPEGYYSTNAEINGYNVKCFGFSDSKMEDFYVIRCYVEKDYSYYRYDKAEGTFQRQPDFVEISNDSVSTKSDTAIIKKLGNISTSGKVIVGCMAIAVLAIIAIIVLFIIKFIRERREISNFNSKNSNFDGVITDSIFSEENIKSANDEEDDNINDKE